MRSIDLILAEWRECAREIQALPETDPRRGPLEADLVRLRAEYLALFEFARRPPMDQLKARQILDASDGVMAQATELGALISERRTARGAHRRSLDAAIARASELLLEEALVETEVGSDGPPQRLSINDVAEVILGK
jgi:hypothetical protein